MKKFCFLILMLTLLFMMSTTAFAASNETYRLDELGLSIDIPSDYVVFTRDIADDDPNLSVYGLNKNDMSDLMESRNLYLDAWDTYVNFEITVTMTDISISDFNLISDTTLNFLASSFTEEYASYGITIDTCEIYQHDQAKFLKIYQSKPDGANIVYGLQYYTVYDHKAINITMLSYSGAIDSEKGSILASIVKTVHFDQEPLRMEPPPDTEAFLYRDEDTGCEFTVPANWTQKPLSQDRETIDVEFASNKEPGLCIFYGSTDIWAEMSFSEKKGLTRADIDNTIYSPEEFAESAGVEKGQISTVSYGGKEYFAYTTTISTSEYGFDFEATQTYLIRFENGYGYNFQFAGDSTSPYYDDFVSLLESVKYPAVESTSPPNYDKPSESAPSSNYDDPVESTPPSSYADTANRATPSGSDSKYIEINLFFSLLITITIYSVPIFVYRYAIIKQPVEKSRAKKITIIYAAIAFVVMSFLLYAVNGSGAAGGAIVLWSLVNYGVLTGGKDRRQVDEWSEGISRTAPPVAEQSRSVPEAENSILASDFSEMARGSQTDPGEENVVFCHQCGTKLNGDCQFCYKCGAKIIK